MSALTQATGVAPARDRPPATADRRLVERAQQGDRQAFGQLYQRHVDDVYAYIRLRVGDDGLAEDLTQDVFMGALRGLRNFAWQGSLTPWLMRSAHNRVANHWRSVGRRPDEVALPEDDPNDARPELALMEEPDPRFVLDVSSEVLEDCIRHLTELQQQVVGLRFAAGLSLLETADAMGRSVNAVKNLQHKALLALRARLDATGAMP